MLTRLAHWWLARSERRRTPPPGPVVMTGECICGKQVAGAELHLVVALSFDDADLGIDGSTAMSADFCAEHCPGGCLHGCIRSEA